jgi:endonuclease/exonuclease/phosphatase (EEP) superfamily protein YafD
LPRAIERLEDNVEARFSQVREIKELIQQEQGPVIVAGDLNSPEASLVSRTLREAKLHDAFAEAGKGYGYTYGHFLLRNRLPLLNSSWMRIDHIMMSPHLEAQRCWAGPADASEHRPVIADLVLKRP